MGKLTFRVYEALRSGFNQSKGAPKIGGECIAIFQVLPDILHGNACHFKVFVTGDMPAVQLIRMVEKRARTWGRWEPWTHGLRDDSLRRGVRSLRK